MHKTTGIQMKKKRYRKPHTSRIVAAAPALRPMAVPALFVALCWLAAGLLPAESTWSQTASDRTVTSATSPDAEVSTVADYVTRIRPTTSRSASPDGTRRATAPSGPATRPPQPEAPSVGPMLGNQLTKQLWRSRMAAPDPNEDIETRRALAQLIKQIRSVEFGAGEQPPTFDLPTEFDEPKEPEAPEPLPIKPWKTAVEAPGISTQTEETTPPAPTDEALKRLVQDADHIQDPLELAELLFLSSRRAEAAVLYQKALDRLDMNAPTAHEDRAWILFQLGNCLRETDMIGARDTYVKLVEEYPDSPWTELAQAHGRLIAWYQKARPRQLLNQPKP